MSLIYLSAYNKWCLILDMSAANEIKAYQRKEYLSKFVNESVRPDNRGLGDTREAVSTSKDMYCHGIQYHCYGKK